MSSFTRPLKTEVLSKSRRILQPFRFWLGRKYCTPYVTVPYGLVFDGASIPKFLWPVVGHPYDSDFVQAAAVHDYLYQNLGRVTIPIGFCDYTPTILYVGMFKTKKLVANWHISGSKLVIQYTRKGCDMILYLGCKVLPCSNWKANIIYEGVRLGGWHAWNKYKRKVKND